MNVRREQRWMGETLDLWCVWAYYRGREQQYHLVTWADCWPLDEAEWRKQLEYGQ